MKKLAVLSTLLFVCAAGMFAQATAGLGAVSGTVLDASGAPVGGAKVSVANPSLGVTRELTTTDGGIFVAPALARAVCYRRVRGSRGWDRGLKDSARSGRYHADGGGSRRGARGGRRQDRSVSSSGQPNDFRLAHQRPPRGWLCPAHARRHQG